MLKKYLAIIYFFLLLLALGLRVSAQNITGAGTQSDPYVLYTAAHFDSIRYFGAYYKTYYKFGNDIDFASWGYFTPIDSIPHMLDGNGYVLKNIKLYTETQRVNNAIFIYGSRSAGSNDTVKNIVFYKNEVIINNAASTFTADSDIKAALLLSNSNYARIINCTFLKNKITILGRQAATSGNDIQNLYVGLAWAYNQFDTHLKKITAIENKVYINGKIDAAINAGILVGLGASRAMEYIGMRNNSLYVKNHKTTQTLTAAIGGIEGKSFGVGGGFMFSSDDTIKIVNNNYTYLVGGLCGSISKGAIIGSNPSFYKSYSRTIFILDSANFHANNHYHPLYGDYYNITFYDNLYQDTLSYGENFPYGITIPNSTPIDSVVLRDSTQLTKFDFNYDWDLDKTGSWGYYPIFQTYMPTLNLPVELPEPAINLIYPNGGETYNYPDTINITFTTNIDTQLIYYSFNDGSTWSFLDTAFVDTSTTNTGHYTWSFPDSTSLQVRIKVCRDNVADSSAGVFFIIGTGATIKILSASLSGENITANIETNYVDTLLIYQGADTLALNLVSVCPVNPGDGVYPDTTNIVWSIADLAPTKTLYIKAKTNNRFNIYSADYTDSLRNSGRSGYYVSAQAPVFHSNVFKLDGDYYRISWKAEIWGWYDKTDRIGVWKFNKTILTWEKISWTYTKGVFYPQLNGYRSADGFVITNKNKTNPRYYVSPTTTTAYNFGAMQSGTFPASIDQENTTVTSGTWIYSVDGNNIIASDIATGTAFVFIKNISVTPAELVIIDDKYLMVTRNAVSGQGGEPYSYIYPLLRSNIAEVSDIYSLNLLGSRLRNYFRGIFPRAIINYYPPMR